MFAGIAQRHRRHVPRDVADVIRAAAHVVLVLDRLPHLGELGRQARLRRVAEFLLQRLGQRLVGLAPLGQADALDVGVHGLGDRLVEVLRIGRAEDARGPRGVGHQRRALGHLVADVPQFLDVRLVVLAEVEPDAGVARHDVGLVAAVGDDRVRALRQAQVLAAVVPADAHQLDRVERRAAAPRRAGAVGRLAFEGVLDRHQAVAAAGAPRHVEVVADVREERDVDVLEHAVAHEPRLAGHAALRPRRARASACRAASRAP